MADRSRPRLAPLEQLFKALADQTRLRILALVAGGEVCVCDIHEALKIPQPRASRHLAYLRRSGLVVDRKDGLWVHYRLAQPDDPLLKTLLSSVVHCLGHVPGVEAAPVQARPDLPCCAGGRGGPPRAGAQGCCVPETPAKRVRSASGAREAL